jgi:DNA-directed RNA polymerase subunit H (RpoH/RPB5)
MNNQLIDSSKLSLRKVLHEDGYTPDATDVIFDTTIGDGYTDIEIDNDTVIIYDMNMESNINSLANWFHSRKYKQCKKLYIMSYDSNPSIVELRDKLKLSNSVCNINIYNIKTQLYNNNIQVNDSHIDRCNMVLKQMLIDRGTHNDESTTPLFTTIPESKYSVLLKNRHDKANTLIVYDLSDKFRWTVLNTWLENNPDYTDSKISLVIFVIQASISSSLKKIKLADTSVDTQVFELSDLQMNISRHFLQPKMELIKDTEVIKGVISDYNLKSIQQLPQMLRDDKMAKYFNAKPGNMMKIHRISPTAGINVFYRIIV